jgi:hypothetical protein
MNELKDDGEIDVLFLGGSHTQGGYDVSFIEENTGLNVFNCSSVRQTTQISYYLLKYVNENHEIKQVWLDLTYHVQALKAPEKYATYLAMDYIDDKELKYECLFKSFGVEGLMNGIMPCLHSSSIGFRTIKLLVKGENLENPYEYVTWEDERYAGQGFVYRNTTMTSDFTFDDSVYINPDNLISDYAMGYLNRIIEYCNDNDIGLILVSPPITDVALVESGYYQEFIDCVRKVASANGLEYLDFSLTKKDALSLCMSDYQNYSHLNGQGAEKFSECVSKILNGELDESAFYDTFAEKLANNPDGTAK